MDTPILPNEMDATRQDEPQSDSDESIIYQTDVPDQPDQATALKKLLLFFKGKPAETAEEANQAEVEKLTTAPAPARSQGPRRKVKSSARTPDPDMRLRAFMTPPPASIPAEKAPKKLNLRPTRENTRRAFWDVAGGLSLLVNLVLIAIVVIMAGQIKNMKAMMNGLLGGLYSNFVDMDKASITTNIPVEAQIPVVFSLPVNQTTAVTLTSDVTIPRTGVVINSGGLSINAPATITLPEGTNLPIALNMDIPVQITIPISLQVPVDIPMNKTMLHTPFTGLQDTIKPLYCTINKNAQYPQGIYICNQQNSPSAGNP